MLCGIGGDEPEYYITYKWRDRDTKKVGKFNGEFITPTPIAKMVSDIGNSFKPKKVADLCCGIGNLSRFFVYSDVDAYKPSSTDYAQISQHIRDYDEIFNDDDGYPD